MEDKNIYEKLNDAQLELKAPKGQRNTFGKFNYRSAEDILEAVKPINNSNRLNLKLTDKPIQVGDRIYVEATAILTNIDKPEEVIELTAYARESLNKKGMDDSQITGTASSYARKYCLNGLYLIDDTKDADTNEYRNNINNAPKPKKVNKKQISALNAVIKSIAQLVGQTVPQARKVMLKEKNLPSNLEEMNENQYGEFLRYAKGLKQDLKEKAKQAKKNDKKTGEPVQESLMDGNTTAPKGDK